MRGGKKNITRVLKIHLLIFYGPYHPERLFLSHCCEFSQSLVPAGSSFKTEQSCCFWTMNCYPSAVSLELIPSQKPNSSRHRETLMQEQLINSRFSASTSWAVNSVKLTSSARLPWKSHSTVDNVYGDDKRFSRGHELLFSLLIIQHNPFKSQRMAVFLFM